MTEPPDITALVITRNEAANIARCLEQLAWLPRVLVMDSFSTDETVAMARTFPNVTVVQREFDSFASQCNAGLRLIESEWVLSLDCDYIVGDRFADEARSLVVAGTSDGFKAGFRYCIHGRPLRASLYPPRCVLYRKAAAHYEDEGHGHRVRVNGIVKSMRNEIAHDDRKPLSRWFASQMKYAEREAMFLLTAPRQELSRIDCLRASGWIMPVLTPLYCLLVKGLWRDGAAGWHYTLQRWVAECVIALALAEQRCTRP